MKFLHIVQRYAPAVGGSEWYMRKISEGLAARGHEVHVLTTTALDVDSLWRSDYAHVVEGDEVIAGVQVHRLRPLYLPFHGKAMTLLSLVPALLFKGRFSMPGPLLPDLGKIIEGANYDVVHAAALPFTSLFWAASRIADRFDSNLIFSPFMHFAVPDRLGYGYTKPYQIEMLKKADLVVAQTMIEKNGLASMGVSADAIKILGLGIETEGAPVGDGARFRERHGIKNAIAFNISARTFDKGAIHTLDAMRMLWKRGVDITLVMAGPARDDFKALAKTLNDTEKSRLLDLGVVDEQTKNDAFASADVFVMPSRSESFGIVYLESWLAGVPVVAARAGAVPDVVRDGEDGVLVEFGDVEAIASAIEKIVTDNELKERMGAAGRKKVLSEYLWKNRFERYVGMLEELTGGKI